MAKKIRYLLIVGLLVFLITRPMTTVFAPEKEYKEAKEVKTETIYLKARVLFTGTQFIITNRNSFSWKNAIFEVNSQLVKGEYIEGYLLKVERSLIAWRTYKVGCMLFCKADTGMRFDPWKMRVLNFTIKCDIRRKRKGFWFGEFEIE